MMIMAFHSVQMCRTSFKNKLDSQVNSSISLQFLWVMSLGQSQEQSMLLYRVQLQQPTYRLGKHQQLQEVSFKKCNSLEYSVHATVQPGTLVFNLVLTASKVDIDEQADLREVEKTVNQLKAKQ